MGGVVARLAAILATVCMVACDGIPGTDESAAKDALKGILNDPSSAKIRVLYSRGDAVCGYVNAKNMMGAYVGAHPFIVDKMTHIPSVFTGAVSLSDYEEWDNAIDMKDDSREKEKFREISDACGFRKNWAKQCDEVSAQSIEYNEDFCKKWEAGDIQGLSAEVRR